MMMCGDDVTFLSLILNHEPFLQNLALFVFVRSKISVSSDRFLFRRNLVVKTTDKNPNKYFLFFKSPSERPPTYDEAVHDEESAEWVQVSQNWILDHGKCLKTFLGSWR